MKRPWLVFVLMLSSTGGLFTVSHHDKVKTLDRDEVAKLWFAWYNEKYFLNTLPKDTTVQWELKLDDYGETWRTPSGHFIIHLSPTYNVGGQTMRTTLLHEMCHIPTYDVHEVNDGPAWRTCINGLISEGAYDDLL